MEMTNSDQTQMVGNSVDVDCVCNTNKIKINNKICKSFLFKMYTIYKEGNSTLQKLKYEDTNPAKISVICSCTEKNGFNCRVKEVLFWTNLSNAG